MQEIAEKIETVAPAREEARDGRIEIFYARTRKYAISDYNQKEEWWEGYFIIIFIKISKIVKKKCLNMIMCGTTTKYEAM
jgi:hypothetical protein